MNTIDLDGLDPNLEPESEKFHRLARIGLGAVPLAGGAMVEVFNSILESPLSKRRTDTMLLIGQTLNDLIEKGVVTEEDLQENEAFISTVAEVCNITLRNHQEEKLDALRNAVKNSALPSCPSDDYRQLFLNFVDVCTVTHIKLLQLFYDPKEWFKSREIVAPNWTMGSLSSVIDLGLPDIKGHVDIRDSIWKDLYQRGLVTTDGLNATMSGDGMFARRTSPLGAKLIEFIS
ncbi:hypothetical protein PS663_00845 [Pseudomonas fluorescens]|nr:hypothetical protein PS663_00845 [Pseudomonas fluorescens]